MRICIFKGSPNIDGSSNMLAQNFIGGAMDAAHANISPCAGCVH